MPLQPDLKLVLCQIKHLVYMGVHENMCIMGRPFAIEQMTRLGFVQDDIAVIKELVDVM